jgi:sporulation protein YunB
MLSSNILLINEIVSNITLRIQEELEKKENSSFNVKLGSFTGIKILSGRGPNINVKISMIGNLDTELKSEFTTSGINQTVHRIYLQISCNVSILTPFETREEKIVNQVLLAEAVIVGTPPNTYYNFDNANEDMALETIQ